MKPRHILLTTDFSKEAEWAFSVASDLASTYKAKITLLHVVPTMPAIPHGAPLAPPIMPPSVAHEEEAAKPVMEEKRALLAAELEVETAVVPGEELGPTIAGYAREHGVDLICMSTHGHSGLKRLVLGSVAEAVLRRAHVPVLCVPPLE